MRGLTTCPVCGAALAGAFDDENCNECGTHASELIALAGERELGEFALLGRFLTAARGFGLAEGF